MVDPELTIVAASRSAGLSHNSNNGLQAITGAQSGASGGALNVQKVFNYDRVNRITSFTDNGSGSALARNFAYTDASGAHGQLGNVHTTSNALGLPPVPVSAGGAFDPTTNRLAASDSTSGQTSSYDYAGNLKSVGSGSATAYSFIYDAENRQITSADNSTGTVTNYVYDGEGRRVRTFISGQTGTTFVYDAFGRMVADYGTPPLSPPYHTCYLSFDHLGSTRMVTDESGNVVARHDYAPFGDELTSGYSGRTSLWGASDQVRQKFAGAEQDNQDVSFFQARYYMPAQGEFNSPDPMNFGADLVNPGSWNGYSYVTNSPLSDVDPSGLGGVVFNFGGAQSGSNGQGGGFTFFGWCFSGCGSGSSGSGKPPSKKPAQGPTTSGFVQRASQIGNNALTSFGNAMDKASDFANTYLAIPVAAVQLAEGADGTPAESNATEELESAVPNFQSFRSFRALKSALGSLGDGSVWHHIVEQRGANIVKFGSEAIHNTENVAAVSGEINQQIANYYSRIRPFTGGNTVRMWLGAQSYNDQLEFGKRILDLIRNGQGLP